MATYKEIQTYVKEKYHITVKTCWIADVKEKYQIKKRTAPNRISLEDKVNPCPEKHQSKIVDAFNYFGMIKS